MLNSISALVLAAALALTGTTAHAKTVWIDVRSAMEHMVYNIEGDQQVSHDEVLPFVKAQYPDKSTPINLYCMSGARSERARNTLIEAGYTNVTNIGGISDAERVRGID